MNLEIIYKNFKSYQLIFTGDLNCRIGTPSYNMNLKYSSNPDPSKNTNGLRLLRWLTDRNAIYIVNGLNWKDKMFESKFSFYRGNLCSRNDLVLTNNPNLISSFKILEKSMYSDHCAPCTTCVIKPSYSLDIITKCANGAFNDVHYDINKRKTAPLKLSKTDWVKAIPDLQEQSLRIQNCIQNGINNDQLHLLLTTTIYDTCKKNYKTKSKLPIRLPNNKNCNSRNYQAIANMNLYTYETQIQNGIPFEQCMHFLENWTNFEQLAIEADTRELNLQINKSWKNAKRDGKKLWDLIDWHGKAEIKKKH